MLSMRMSTSVANSCILILFFILLCESRVDELTESAKILVSNFSRTTNAEVTTDENISNAKGSGNYGWGWGAGGGGGGGRGQGGGGGGGWFGCRSNNRKRSNKMHKKRVSSKHNFVIGEFAECMANTRCYGKRLDCPIHCGGPCLYDCVNMCKPHCRRDH